MGFLIIIPVGFLLSLAWVLWTMRPQRPPDANDTMQWHRRSMAALAPGRDPGPGLGRLLSPRSNEDGASGSDEDGVVATTEGLRKAR